MAIKEGDCVIHKTDPRKVKLAVSRIEEDDLLICSGVGYDNKGQRYQIQEHYQISEVEKVACEEDNKASKILDALGEMKDKGRPSRERFHR